MQLPDMFLQIKVPAETFTTSGTGKGLLVIVRVHVEGEVVDLMKCLAADGTFKLFFPTVGQLVILVVPCKV